MARLPVTDRELDEAYLANALFDAHRDDPEFGYRSSTMCTRPASSCLSARCGGAARRMAGGRCSASTEALKASSTCVRSMFSNRIVGWAIDKRMTARLVVAAI